MAAEEYQEPVLGQVGELLSHMRWLLGERWRWIGALPVLSVVAAASEVVLLVSIVRSLLLLVEPESMAEVGLGPLNANLSAGSLLALAAAASLCSISFRAAESVVVGRLAARAAFTARSRLIDSYFAADWRAMARLRSGHLQQLLGNNVMMASNAVPLLATMLAAFINLAIYGGFVAASSPLVGAVFVALGLVVVSAFSLLQHRTKADGRASQSHVREVQLAATTLSSLNRELQLFDVRGAARHELHGLNTDARLSLARLRTMQRLVPNLFQQIVLLAVVGLIVLARELGLDASSFGTAAILALRSLSYLQMLNSSKQTYVEVAPYVREIRDAIDEHLDEVKARGAATLGTVDKLELDSVSFGYEDSPAVRGVTLDVRAGEWLGIVGPSGSGKTTLANLIAGLLGPGEGRYRVNGEDAVSFSAASWASHFALLSQEPVLIRGTIAENISFYRSGGQEAVDVAASKAAIAADVESFPLGWSTPVGDGQAALSGGQRQRIALARALFGQPSVLILDEPTSALDAENARLIEESIADLEPNVIVIVVSHRPALLGRCGRVLVMEDGVVVSEESPSGTAVQRHVGQT